MNDKILNNLLENAKGHMGTLSHNTNKHFTYIIDKGRIVSFGVNDYINAHPAALKYYNYGEKRLHSEFAAILKFRRRLDRLKDTTLVNIRLNSLGKVGMSKPCPTCANWIVTVGFKRVIYTDPDGRFVQWLK
jgi:tRNA(Arg) A34 adenosine deaminase TadA